MDAEDFKTLGECEFGTIWEVQSENKIVVNAYQAALYFAQDDFFQFAKMVEESIVAMTGKGFELSKAEEPSAPPSPPKEPSSEVTQITDIRAFRRNKSTDEDDDFPG